MTIRKAKREDIISIFRVEQSVFKDDFFAISKSSFYYHIRKNNLFVIIDKNNIAGYILWLKRKEYYRLYSLAILQEYRGKSFAKELTNYSLKKLDKNIFTLEVRDSNKKAISLYESIGFKKTKILKNYYTNEDGIKMKFDRTFLIS